MLLQQESQSSPGPAYCFHKAEVVDMKARATRWQMCSSLLVLQRPFTWSGQIGYLLESVLVLNATFHSHVRSCRATRSPNGSSHQHPARV